MWHCLKLHVIDTQKKIIMLQKCKNVTRSTNRNMQCENWPCITVFLSCFAIPVPCKNKTTEKGHKCLFTFQGKVQVNFPAETEQFTDVARAPLSSTCCLQRIQGCSLFSACCHSQERGSQLSKERMWQTSPQHSATGESSPHYHSSLW